MATNYRGPMSSVFFPTSGGAHARILWARWLTASLLVILAVGCQTDTERPHDPPSGRLSGRGTVEGVIRLADLTIPEPTRVRNTTDPELCGEAQSLEDLVVSAVDGGIQNVIVALLDVPPDKIPTRPAERLVLDNQGCRLFHMQRSLPPAARPLPPTATGYSTPSTSTVLTALTWRYRRRE